jgi:hypothetical protein
MAFSAGMVYSNKDAIKPTPTDHCFKNCDTTQCIHECLAVCSKSHPYSCKDFTECQRNEAYNRFIHDCLDG